MSKKLPLYAVIALILASIVVTFCATYAGIGLKLLEKNNPNDSASDGVTFDSSEHEDAFEKLKYVDELYQKYYVGDIDKEQLEAGLIKGYIAGAGDKYASYMTRDDLNSYLSDINGDFVGIGVHVVYNAEYACIEVISVMPDSPALEAGIESGDLIVKIGEESVSDLGYYPAIDKVLGEEGTEVTLTVRRGTGYSEEHTITAERRKIENATTEYRMYDDEIGIVRIYSFSATTDEAVKEAVNALRDAGAKKLIFDVRNNPGGELGGIVNTLDFLLPEGPIVHIVDKNGEEQKTYTSDADCIDIPMAVLVNGNTASAAELFTSALQDYKKAVIVGSRTYGKGTVQSIITLPDGSGLSLSTSMYNPPFSENYEGKGITPDLTVELNEEAAAMNLYKLPDNMDNQLLAAINALN